MDCMVEYVGKCIHVWGHMYVGAQCMQRSRLMLGFISNCSPTICTEAGFSRTESNHRLQDSDQEEHKGPHGPSQAL